MDMERMIALQAKVCVVITAPPSLEANEKSWGYDICIDKDWLQVYTDKEVFLSALDDLNAEYWL